MNPMQRISELLTQNMDRERAEWVLDQLHKELAAMHDQCPYRRFGVAVRKFTEEEKVRPWPKSE